MHSLANASKYSKLSWEYWTRKVWTAILEAAGCGTTGRVNTSEVESKGLVSLLFVQLGDGEEVMPMGYACIIRKYIYIRRYICI